LRINLTIDGVAVPCLRPRHSRNGHTYDPGRSRDFKEFVAAQVIMQKPPMLEGPLSVSLAFYKPRPKSRTKKHKYPDTKPDLDNLVKNILDGVTQSGRVWRDDAQICMLTAVKHYGEPARVEVIVSELE
jgi:Holliday junction resolvase RusA-like endonuclease